MPKPAAPINPYGGLSGANRDAAVALTNLFTSYGLATLAPKILEFIRQGYSADTISILLQDTKEYKQRFAANEKRRAAGLPVLSPGEYLATEKAYRDVMSNAGLPMSFYDQPSDFTNWLSKDVSPTEVQGRVTAAADVVNQGNPDVLAQFQQFYGMSGTDVIAYALDPTRALPLIQKQFRAAQVAGMAAGQGVSADQATSERLAAAGVTQEQARAGFGAVAGELGTVNKLNSIYGADVTQDDLISEVFEDDADARKKRGKLASKERASFTGSGGQSRTSLSSSDSGSI
jgi:hypothetical protein